MNKNERPNIESELLRTFLIIASYGNLTAAAGHLGRTQSAISVQLGRLENALGTSLFHRTPKGMKITLAGQTLLPKAQSITAQLLEASTLFSNPLTGTLRVGIPDDYDEKILEITLHNFSQTHPNVNVLVSAGCTSSYPEALNNGTLDLAVCSGPDNHVGDFLNHEKTLWAAKTDIQLNPNYPIPLAILDRKCWWGDLPMEVLKKTGREYKVAFRSTNFASIQSAIRSGFAVGILPATSLKSGTRALTENDGFPTLPISRRSIAISKSAPHDLCEAMADAIRNAKLNLQA